MQFHGDDVRALHQAAGRQQHRITQRGRIDGIRRERRVGNRSIGHVTPSDFSTIQIEHSSVIYDGLEREFGLRRITGEIAEARTATQEHIMQLAHA